MKRGNLFADLPERISNEQFDVLLRGAGFRLERILSTGQATPAGTWYDQPHDEWVALLKGSAILRFETDDRQIRMEPGDYILIAAHERHRVESTASNQPTVWLALHTSAEPTGFPN